MMGEIADQIWNQYYNPDRDFEDPIDFQYQGVGYYEWKDHAGRVWKMHKMTTEHISNAMRFADPTKYDELFTTLLDRCGIF